MSLSHLLQKIDAIGVFKAGMEITIDSTLTGSTDLSRMLGCCVGQDALKLKTNSMERADDGSSLKLLGTGNLLGLTEAVITFTAAKDRNDGADMHATLAVDLPKDWHFTQSFPFLPNYYDASKVEDERMQPCFLDGLSFGRSRLVFSNQKYFSDQFQAELLPGLNFIGELFLMGHLFGLGTLTGDKGPLTLSGPVVEYRIDADPLDFMGIRLSADMPSIGANIPLVPLGTSKLFIKSRLFEQQGDFDYGVLNGDGIYLMTQAQIDGRTAQIVADFEPGGSADELFFYGHMTDFDLSGMAQLSRLSGQNGDNKEFSGNLPAELQKANGLSLTEFGCAVDFGKPGINDLLLGVGYQANWPLIKGQLELEEVGVTFRVSSPLDSKTRSVAASIEGLIDLQGTKLALFAEIPTLRFGGGLPSGETIPLGDIIHRFVPSAPALPAMTVSELLFDVDPREKHFTITTSISDLLSIPVGTTSFDIETISCYIDYDSKSGGMGALSAQMTIADSTAMLAGEMVGGLTLTGSMRDFDFKKFWAMVTGGEQLPEEIPDIIFDTLNVSVSPAGGDFSLSGNAKVDWDKLPFGGSLSTEIEFSFAVDRTGGAGAKKTGVTARLSLQGDGLVDFADDFKMKSFNFLFEYQTGRGWKLGGGAAVDIFDNELSLQAGYEDSPTSGRVFQLTAMATPEVKLIDLKGIGHYSFRQLDLKIHRTQVQGANAQTFWNFRMDSTLAIDNVVTIAGYLSIFDQQDGRKGLIFNPDKDTATAKIDFPGTGNGGVDIRLFEAGITRESAESGWSFTATVDTSFTGMPGWLDKLLPSTLHAKLVAGKKDVSISAVRVTDPLPIVLPKMNGQSMGTLYFQLTQVGIAVKPTVGLVLEAGMGFSKEVNTLFGGSTIFRVYEPGNILTLARTRLTINEAGLAAQFLSSPFAGANAVVIDGESWFDVDLGEFGALRLKMPTFIYDGVTQYFEAGGGVEVTRPLAVPLKPIKMLLEGVKLKAAADALPASLPIKGVNIVDQHGDFKIDELIQLLESAGEIPAEVKDILRATGDLLDRFPDTFKQYFNIEVPEKLEFKFGFSPTGRIAFGLKTGETPIRFLQSTMVPGVIPMPGLNGIELREVTLGTIMSGSLFQLSIDGHVDTYDFGTLALSLALPSNKSFPLPTSNELQRRLVLNNVFMIIPLQEGVPIPIPIFYDCIGVEHMGIEGVGLQAHLGFPAPKLSGLVEFFSTLKQFFSDRSYLLDPSTPPGIDLTFNLGDNYIQLPEYLGGKVLGLKGKPQSTSAWSGMAHALNFMKTVSLNELIQSIPLENRVGSAEHRFAFLRFDADWLVTTPREFRDGAFTRLKLTAGDRDDFMAVLPAVASGTRPAGGKSEQGLVVFLRGEVDVSVVSLEVVFGLAASGSMGFNTGFKMTGAIANFMALQLGGRIEVNPDGLKTRTGSVVELDGYTYLDFGSHRAFEGDIRITDKGFEFRGTLDLFPKSLPLKATGTLEGWVSSKGFYLAGDVQTALAGLNLLNARAIISDKQVLIEGTFLGVTASLEVWQEADALALKGAVALNLWGFKAQASIYINSVRGAVVQGDVDEINLGGLFKLTGAAGKPKASFYMDFASGKTPVVDISGAVVLLGLRSETQVRVGGGGFSFKTTGKIFNLFEVQLDVSGKQLDRSADYAITATMQNDLFAYLKDKVSQAIKASADEATASITSAQHDLNKAQDKVDSLDNQIKNRRAEIEKGRADAKRKLASAQNAVTSAQNKVNSLNREIKDKEAERDRQSKKQACTSIPIWVPTPKWNNPLKGHWDHKRTCVPDPVAVAKAGGLQAEITGLYTALGTATAGLATAKAALKLAEGAVDVTPIEADPQLAGLYTAKGTATAGLTAAKVALQGAKEAVGAVAAVGDFITRYGLGGLLDVRSATFQAGLSAASGGRVALDLQLEFMGKSQKFDFDFNFNDPLAGAKALAKKLLPG